MKYDRSVKQFHLKYKAFPSIAGIIKSNTLSDLVRTVPIANRRYIQGKQSC